MKKILVGLCFILLIMSVTSCNKYEDVVPNSNDYASWDGNYIYKGNYRSKTTGEDEEKLIKNIEYEGNTYYIDAYDYVIFDDNLYFFFITKSNKELEEFDSSFLVKYIIKEKRYEILYAITDFQLSLKIEKVYDNYIYCIKAELSNGLLDYYIYSFETRDLILIEDVDTMYLLENDVFMNKDNILKHTDCNQINFKTIISLNKNELIIKDDQNSDYIKIISYQSFKNSMEYYSLGYFNKETNEYKELISLEEQKQIYYINEEYFIFYESKNYEYVMNVKERYTSTIDANCMLCKVNLDKLTYEIIYEFKDKDASYTGGIIIGDTYFLKRVKVRKGWFIFYGGARTKTYKLDLTTLKLSRDYDKVINKKNTTIEGVTFNNQFYYLTKEQFGGYLHPYDAYYLYRKSINNEKKELMQFFVYNEDYVQEDYEGTRSAISMWKFAIDFNEEKVLILNY